MWHKSLGSNPPPDVTVMLCRRIITYSGEPWIRYQSGDWCDEEQRFENDEGCLLDDVVAWMEIPPYMENP